jgi:hypothetical protein
VNKAAHRAIAKGQAKTNLGRWSWIRYKGKGSQTLKIIVAYRPNPPQGPFTVYDQQNAYFNTLGRDICPRQAFLLVLIKAINSGLEKGDHILLMMDGNSNMKNSDIVTALQRISLQEIILQCHGLLGPATHKRNSSNVPINGIWPSPGLRIDKGGYFAYDEVITNTENRCLWVEISYMMAFGHNMPPLSKRQPR